MKPIKTIVSQVSVAKRYIFKIDGLTTEVRYIDKEDEKDIICISCQTGCNLGCIFCHLTGLKRKIEDISASTIHDMIISVIKQEELLKQSIHRTLLVSFMGMGEPFRCINTVINSMNQIVHSFKNQYKIVRFGLATSEPSQDVFQTLTDYCIKHNLDVKVHYSLHTCDSYLRKEIVPTHTRSAYEVINDLIKYRNISGNNVELHYVMVDNLNDRNQDLDLLKILLSGKDIPIKFLHFNIKKGLTYKPAQQKRIDSFRESLEALGIDTEFYITSGADIGASCGQFEET